MKNRKIEQKQTKQVVIDAGLHQLLKIEAAKARKTIKELLEGHLTEILEVKSDQNGDD